MAIIPSSRLLKRDTLFAIFLVCLIVSRLILQLATTENSVCGVYCQMSNSYEELFRDRLFDSYFFQKSFNSFLIHILLRFTSKIENVSEINDYLLCLSTFQLCVFIFLWCYISKKFQIHESISVLSLAICLLNPIVFFYHFNYYEIPDASLLLLGLMFSHAFMMRSFKYMFVLYLLSWFVAPQMRIMILLSIVGWPYLIRCDSNIRMQDQKTSSRYFRINHVTNKIFLKVVKCKNLVFGSFCVVNLIVALISPFTPNEYGTRMKSYWILALSIPLGAYIQSGMFLFLARSARLKFWPNTESLSRVGRMFVAMGFLEVLRFVIIEYWGRGPDLAMTSSRKGQLFTLYSWFFESISLPGLFLLMMINAFGFGILVLLKSRNEILNLQYRSVDIHFLSILFLLLFPFLTNTQTRHYLFIMPTVCLFYLKPFSLDSIRFFVIASLYLFSSRFFVLDFKSIEGSTDIFGLRQGPWALKSTYCVSVFAMLFYTFIAIRWFGLSRKNSKMSED